jgi:hypothetical protein
VTEKRAEKGREGEESDGKKDDNRHLLEAWQGCLNVTNKLTEIWDIMRREKGRKKAREGREK